MSEESLKKCVHGEVSKNCGICEDLHALESKIERCEEQIKILNDLVYMYGPGTFSPDGWTYKQQCKQDQKRIEELEFHCKYLQEKLLKAVEKLDKYE